MHAYAQVRTGIYHSLTVCSCSFLSVCIQTLNTLQEEEDMFRDASSDCYCQPSTVFVRASRRAGLW